MIAKAIEGSITNTYLKKLGLGTAHSKRGNLNTYCYLPGLWDLRVPNAVGPL